MAGLKPYDGGFYFSPVALAANKAGGDPRQPQLAASYASATADGMLALVALGVSRDDPRRRDAWQWLRANPGWRYPAGIPDGKNENWREGLRCYHLACRAKAHALMDQNPNWRREMLDSIADLGRPDGLYANPAGFLMKEDDPLLASALILEALVAARPISH